MEDDPLLMFDIEAEGENSDLEPEQLIPDVARCRCYKAFF
jgi:hypothetical protein